jgi:peptidoglycan hydrolase-like protein with peptidoglycan-binding domain
VTDPGDDRGWYPEDWADPIDRDDLPDITEATDDDQVPPADRLAEEPEEVEAEDKGQQPADTLGPTPRIFVPSALPIDLRNYAQTPQQRGWGAPCTARLARVALPGGAAISVDSRLAELVLMIMSANERDGYVYRRADTGAYNCRKIAGTSSWSWHSWAIAVDENWQSNPYTSPLRTDKPVWLRHRWNRYGFAWGGDYTGNKDAMHFEWMGTPQDAVSATALARSELTGQAPAPVVPGPVEEQWKPRADAALGTRVISLWDVGTDVSFVQRWHGLKDDGYFGADTDRAVRDTQRRNGLTVDGEVGPATWRVLGVGGPPPIPAHTMPPWPESRMPRGHFFGDVNGPATSHGGANAWERPYVQAIQRELVEDGAVDGVTDWRSGWADGRWTAPTTQAMAAYQRRHLPRTTRFGECWADDYAALAR